MINANAQPSIQQKDSGYLQERKLKLRELNNFSGNTE